jgi:hypothetical protein
VAHSFDDLIRAYSRHVELPWEGGLSPSERVWILWYGQGLERRVSSQIHQFETITRNAGRGWIEIDVAPLFGSWIAGHKHFARLTKRPTELSSMLPAFAAAASEKIEEVLTHATSDDVVILTGIGSLFGLTSVSRLIERIAPLVPGRLLVTFPGRYQAGAYSLLDARESWNYHATPIPPVSYL